MTDTKKIKWRTFLTPPDGLDYESYQGIKSQVDTSCHEATAKTIARILRGEKVRGLTQVHYDDNPELENPTRDRTYGWADMDKDIEQIKERKEDRKKAKAKADAEKKANEEAQRIEDAKILAEAKAKAK